MPVSKFSQSRSLPSAAAAKAALDILHDHGKLVHCQPLVGEVQQLNTSPDDSRIPDDEKSPKYDWWQQTEHVPILPFGIWKKKVVFNNWFKDFPGQPIQRGSVTVADGAAKAEVTDAGRSEGGVETICYAPSGIKIRAMFRVERRKADFAKGSIASRGKEANDAGESMGSDNEEWRLVEISEMECSNALILKFSERQHRSAHGKMLDNIVHEAKKRAYVPDATGPGIEN
ncbi:hypothetical protein H2198_001441 [Neophaeococcomyces mojaviensis]|uniref:Uncharacterized protein n=1 Tax=Neophaeococcomyces mojaviensis TaxID=3383035 RepID=A0ACC3AH23_9EURO|nr:hypothetical protein H2198_001441 [Knufia sp. JES_112]